MSIAGNARFKKKGTLFLPAGDKYILNQKIIMVKKTVQFSKQNEVRVVIINVFLIVTPESFILRVCVRVLYVCVYFEQCTLLLPHTIYLQPIIF